jgi:hypothetical protein
MAHAPSFFAWLLVRPIAFYVNTLLYIGQRRAHGANEHHIVSSHSVGKIVKKHRGASVAAAATGRSHQEKAVLTA